MTRSDKWKTRARVMRYRAFRDDVKRLGITVQDGDNITFIMPMAESWSEKKKAAHDGKAHRQKPDLDNLLKALLDAIYEDDCHISALYIEKIWGREGSISILRCI